MTVSAELEIDRRDFRRALSHYASGLTVIAARHNEEPMGFTCQAFQSVSEEPPLVSFCVMSTSKSYPRIREAERFSVNVLSEHQQHLADQFASKASDRWSGVQWTESAAGNPIIAGTVMWLDCEIHSEFVIGDHTLVVGAVQQMSPAGWCEHEPLLYHRGAYRRPSG